MSKAKLSRRNFISGAALFGLGGITLGLNGCANADNAKESKQEESSNDVADNKGNSSKTAANNSNKETTGDWLGQQPEVNESDVKQTIESEIIIIGAGNAGLAAAATASDYDLNVQIFEKNGMIQQTRHWFGAIDTMYTKQNNLTVDHGLLLNELGRYASNQCSLRVINVWINESAEMVDWLDPILTKAGMVCDFDAKPIPAMGGTSYHVPPMQHYYHGETTDGKRIVRNEVLYDYIKQKGYDVNFEHELIKLIKDGDKITGVYFKTKDGIVKALASKAVIMATGGYNGNSEMLRACNPLVDQCVTAQVGAITNTGDGIKAALWAGASKDSIGAPMIFDRGAVQPGVNAGIVEDDKGRAAFSNTYGQFNLGSQPLLKVNREGKRFINESSPYNDCCFAAAQYDGGVFCQIFDDKLKENVKRFDTTGCSALTQITLAKGADKPIDEIYEKAIKEGLMFKADTLEELADKLGFKGEAKDNLLAEIERNNMFFDNQHDEDFGKEPYRLSEIRTAPFYGTWFGGAILTTVDGIRINEHMQAITDNGKVLEGLYAIGDCSGSFYANNYPEYLPGNAMGRTLTFARHAVKHIAGKLDK